MSKKITTQSGGFGITLVSVVDVDGRVARVTICRLGHGWGVLAGFHTSLCGLDVRILDSGYETKEHLLESLAGHDWTYKELTEW